MIYPRPYIPLPLPQLLRSSLLLNPLALMTIHSVPHRFRSVAATHIPLRF